MGISIELWRARIGLFACRGGGVRGGSLSNNTPLPTFSTPTASSLASSTASSDCILRRTLALVGLALVFQLLTRAGDVELNPGPNGHKTQGGMAACVKVNSVSHAAEFACVCVGGGGER